MRLFTSPNSPYARKARIIIHEVALTSRVEEMIVSLPADAKLRAVNPLGKIPALLLDDGSVIYDSRVICEYLDALGGGKFFPRATLFREAEGRWRALTLQALGDGLADAVVRRNQEMRLPESRRNPEVLARQTAAIEGAFAVADRAAAKFPAEPTIGEIAIACAIGYLDLRAPHDGWRDRHPQLARWLDAFSQRPSVQATRPPPA
jgi:glutathione S-transferase